jgi:hypothetical protein
MINKFIFFEKNEALIEDYFYYTDHLHEIDDWLYKHNCLREGMNLYFADENTKMLFRLRWE